ncbi:MAG: hypothetical protein M3Z26_07220 [Bacteroidota bacterium]|nr:hypothetical protein [Bacteroidota bacterium]
MLLNRIYFFASVFFISILLFSCDLKTDNITKNLSADEIMKADKEFSDMSRQVGMKKAFLEYIDNDGTLLRPNHLPLIGAEAIDFLSLVNDSAYSLTWKPTKAEISKSGDLGYSFGVYQLATKDTILKGTYVSIWKKQSTGAWKFVLDSGNEGISPKQ